jgi:hypothetical protein
MHDPRIDLLNAEIREHEDWLNDHPNHPADDKVQVRMSLISKTLKRNELIKAQLTELVNKEHEI